MTTADNKPLTAAVLQCPNCQKPFDTVTLPEQGDKFFCQTCKEYWLRKGELSQMVFRPDDFPNYVESHAFAEITTVKCPECPDATVDKVPYVADLSVCVMCCAKCKGILVNQNVLSWIRRWEPKEQFTFFGLEGYLTDPSLLHLIVFPFATLFPMIAKALVLPEFLMNSAIMVFHELGHAIVSWSTGRVAIPSIAFTFLGGQESMTFSISLVLLLSFGAFFAWQENYRHLAVAMALEVIFIAWLAFGLTAKQRQMMIVFGGVGGEFVIPAFLSLMAFFPMPEFMGWQKWRFISMLFGYYGVMRAYTEWREIAAGTRPLPMGSLIHGSADGQGDLNRLFVDFGWTSESLINIYQGIGYLCFALIWIVYLYIVYLAYLDRLLEADKEKK